MIEILERKEEFGRVINNLYFYYYVPEYESQYTSRFRYIGSW